VFSHALTLCQRFDDESKHQKSAPLHRTTPADV
ncbi:MAG: hypothetical protein ACI8RD_002675, partial [Bacillariaceae sp.]